ncbi:MAG: Hsp20 family protein [Oscillospiraceae bacterium]|nr:Hsp20 family protein [Oscillospiraceae bacterium]
MPGFSKADVKIDIEGDYLTLSAERADEKEEKGAGYIRRERSFGSFKRSFNIENVDSEKHTPSARTVLLFSGREIITN